MLKKIAGACVFAVIGSSCTDAQVAMLADAIREKQIVVVQEPAPQAEPVPMAYEPVPVATPTPAIPPLLGADPYAAQTPVLPLTAEIISKKNGTTLGLGKYIATVRITNPNAMQQSGTVRVTILAKGESIKDFTEQVTLQPGQSITRTYEDSRFKADDATVTITSAPTAYGTTPTPVTSTAGPNQAVPPVIIPDPGQEQRHHEECIADFEVYLISHADRIAGKYGIRPPITNAMTANEKAANNEYDAIVVSAVKQYPCAPKGAEPSFTTAGTIK